MPLPPLIDGLEMGAEVAFRIAAEHDNIPAGDAAGMLDQVLRKITGGSR